MKMQARNRLTMVPGSVAARRDPTRNDCYSWVWVLPLESGEFRVAAIEVPKHFIDNDESFFDGDMDIPFERIVHALDGVDQAVLEAGVDPEELDAPWHSDFPL